jgi:hypothetical protein
MAVRIAVLVVFILTVQAAAEPKRGGEAPQPRLTAAIVAWLVAEFDLPPPKGLPRLAFVPPAEMGALRLRGAAPIRRFVKRPGNASPAGPTEILAFYDSRTGTIYLPEGWSGDTAAGSSMLVHEMVHHLQEMSGIDYPCAEAREKLAFQAQERWLALFGSSLAREFGMEPMTLLVRTSCF